MPQVIVVRLVPAKPTSGPRFTAYLTNLSIKAFDLSVGSPTDGTLIGEAQGGWIPDAGPGATGPVFTPATQKIIQHFTPYNRAPPWTPSSPAMPTPAPGCWQRCTRSTSCSWPPTDSGHPPWSSR